MNIFMYRTMFFLFNYYRVICLSKWEWTQCNCDRTDTITTRKLDLFNDVTRLSIFISFLCCCCCCFFLSSQFLSLFNMNVSTSFMPMISHIHCYLYRFVGSLLLMASLINLYVSVRYFLRQYCYENKRLHKRRFSHILTSMLISSILVIFTGIPLVVIQCFSCRPYLAYEFICHIHGFICFATGLFNM
jgi:hypothetical protein